METFAPRITTHVQADLTRRERQARDRKPQGRPRRYDVRPYYERSPRSWSNTSADIEAARHPKFKFNVPDWLLPKNGVDIWGTISASIVWGLCGRMADMEMP